MASQSHEPGHSCLLPNVRLAAVVSQGVEEGRARLPGLSGLRGDETSTPVPSRVHQLLASMDGSTGVRVERARGRGQLWGRIMDGEEESLRFPRWNRQSWPVQLLQPRANGYDELYAVRAKRRSSSKKQFCREFPTRDEEWSLCTSPDVDLPQTNSTKHHADLGTNFFLILTGWTTPLVGQSVVVLQSSIIRSPMQPGEHSLGVVTFEHLSFDVIMNYQFQSKQRIDAR